MDDSQTPRARRVLALGPESWGGFGGIAQGTRDYLTALIEAAGVEHLTLVSRHPADGGPEPPAVVEQHVRSGAPTRFVLEALRRGRALKPDLIACLHVRLMPVATLLRALTGAPVWLFVHGIDAWEPGPPLRRRAVTSADLVTASSRHTRERLLSWAALDPARVEVLNNPVHTEELGPAPKPEYLLDRHDLRDRRVLLTLGCLRGGDRRKGHDELLDLLPTLLERVPDLAWLVVGDGADRARLERRVERAGLQRAAIFAGRIPEHEKRDHYNVADAFALLSQSEGFGIAYVEAAACGLPILGSALDGSRDALLDGALGRLVDPSDTRALLTQLERLLRTPRRLPAELAQHSFERLPPRMADLLARHFGRQLGGTDSRRVA